MDQLIGTLKKFDTSSKVDEQKNRQIHTITMKLELLENDGIEKLQKIVKSLNKPIRVDFDPVQLQADFKK